MTLTHATGAMAQDQQAPVVLPDVVVQGQTQGHSAEGPINGYTPTNSRSGSKTDTPIVETPQTINVIGRKEIEDRDATTLQEALEYTPGVASFSSGRSLILDEFNIRGFDTSGGSLGQLRDGLKLQSNVYDGSQEPYGLEKVEVLKGPASILYGQLGPGGIVNSVTKRPTFTNQGELNITGGSFGDKQISGDISGPIGTSGEWAYRITGLARDSGTWIHFIDDDKTYIAPALTYAPTNKTSITLLGFYQSVHSRLAAPMDADGTVFPVPGVGRIPTNLFIGDPNFDRYDGKSGGVTLLMEHEVNSHLKVTSRARYWESKVFWNYLTDANSLVGSPGIDTSSGTPQIDRGVSQRVEHSKNVTTDNNVQLKFDTGLVAHTAVVGVDYARTMYDTHRQRNGSDSPLDIFSPDYSDSSNLVVSPRDTGFNQVIDQAGVYFQDQLKIAGKLVLLAGGRQDWATTTSYLNQLSAAAQFPKENDSAFTKRFGAVYLAPYGFAPYVSYSESFSPVIGATNGVDVLTKPTTGSQYEGGLRWQSHDEKTLLTAAVYTIDQHNVVTFDSDFNFHQSGLVRSHGFEFEAKTTMGPLHLTAAYAYTDAKTLEDDFSALIGQRVALVPLNQASVFAIYDFGSVGLRGLSMGGGVRYFGETNIPPDQDLGLPAGGNTVPGYVMVDAVARMELAAINPKLKGFSAQINAKNLFDKQTYSCTAGFQGCNYGQPRTVQATLSYKW